VIAGIGNVYRSELLNIVGIDPRRPGRAVRREEFDALWMETVRQLKLGVRRNRIVTMGADELPRPLSKLRRGEGRYVYKQDHCGRCRTELDIYPIAGRTTWSCPVCQPSYAPRRDSSNRAPSGR
jgi:endonuclease-8